MPVTGAQSRAQIARAIWAFTTMDQRKLADASGIKYSRLRAIMARENPDEATLDELLALANAAGVPEAFALEGFQVIASGEGRLKALEEQIRTGREDRDALAGEIEALRDAQETLAASLARRISSYVDAELQRGRRQGRADSPPPEEEGRTR